MTLKTVVRALSVSSVLAVSMGISGNLHADLIDCDSLSDDITNKVTPNQGCQILDPLDANVNDSVAGGNNNFADFTVNTEEFFGFNDWLFDAKEFDGPAPSTVSFDGDQQAGTWELTDNTLWQSVSDLMFVFKDGNATNLVGYLIAGGATNGVYASPFTEGPFDFNGVGPKDISHISIYYREGSVSVPEPGTFALLALGLVGLGFKRRQTKS